MKIAPFRVFSISCEKENFPSAPSCAASIARDGDVARRGRLGREGKPRPREAVIAVELAHQPDHSVHRLKIALHHHRTRDDHRLTEPGDL